MTSSTTRAFMAKKQSTTFAQVATNLLNVLQGYTKGMRLMLIMLLTLTLSANAWAEEMTYEFHSKSWETEVGEIEANWTSDKEGADFLTLTAQWEEIVLSNNCRHDYLSDVRHP